MNIQNGSEAIIFFQFLAPFVLVVNTAPHLHEGNKTDSEGA